MGRNGPLRVRLKMLSLREFILWVRIGLPSYVNTHTHGHISIMYMCECIFGNIIHMLFCSRVSQNRFAVMERLQETVSKHTDKATRFCEQKHQTINKNYDPRSWYTALHALYLLMDLVMGGVGRSTIDGWWGS